MDTQEKLDALKVVYEDERELNGVLTKLLELALSRQRRRLARYEQELGALERRYDMSSADFYARFAAGELGDELDLVEWAGLYELEQDLRQRIQRLEGLS